MQHKPTIAVDFDGVIHSYISGWQGDVFIPDLPVEGAIDWLNEISQTYQVIIFSTRAETPEGQRAVEGWLSAQGYKQAEVTCKKPPALIYLDDRAVRFEGPGTFPSKDEIEKLSKPWYKG